MAMTPLQSPYCYLLAKVTKSPITTRCICGYVVRLALYWSKSRTLLLHNRVSNDVKASDHMVKKFMFAPICKLTPYAYWVIHVQLN